MNSFNNELQNILKFGSDYWKRYTDVISVLSPEQKSFVNKQQNVNDAKKIMYESFMDFLFEQNKDAFVSVADGKYRIVVDNYIKEIQIAADSYVSHAEQLERENQELKVKIESILKSRERNNESMAANGSRRGGKDYTQKAVQSGNNTGCNGNDIQVPENRS